MDKCFQDDNSLPNVKMVRAATKCQVDMAEVYSLQRILGGVSLDFTVPGNHWYIWDFDKTECRQKAVRLADETKACVLVGSLERTPFLTLQNLNMRTSEGCEKGG